MDHRTRCVRFMKKTRGKKSRETIPLNLLTELVSRVRHRKCDSVIAITLHYIFALSHNASTLWRKVIASFSYPFGLIEIVIASYSYRSSLKGIVIASYSYRSKVTNRYRFLYLRPNFRPLGWTLTARF